MRRFIQWMLAITTLIFSGNLYAQDNVGIGTINPNPRALLHLDATDKGFLAPRLTTTQRQSLGAAGLADQGILVYDTDDRFFYFWDGNQWVPIPNQGNGFNISMTYDPVTGELALTDPAGTLTATIIAGDADSTNELQDLSNTVSGSDVTINITQGIGTTFSINDADADPSNELQNLTMNQAGNTINWTLSNGGGSGSFQLSDNDWSGAGTGSMYTTNPDNVGIGTSTPSTAAVLELSSTSQGFLPPRMTSAQRMAIAAPPTGLEVFDTDAGVKLYYDGTRWREYGAPPIGTIQAWHKSKTSTPALPYGWVECNGQTLADPESPYNGQAIEDLNGGGRFLRGSATSGTLQADDFAAHSHTGTTAAAGDHSHSIDPPSATTSTDGAHTHSIDPPSATTNTTGAHTHSVDPPSTNTSTAGSHTHSIDPPNTNTSTAGAHNHGGSTGNVNSNTSIYMPWDDNANANSAINGNGGGQVGLQVTGASTNTPWNGRATVGNFIGTFGNQLNHRHVINTDGNHAHSVNIAAFTSGAAGNHNHAVNIAAFNSASAGNHNHTVDIAAFSSASAGDHNHAVDIAAFNSANAGSHTHSFATNSAGGSETRPVNMSVVWIMRVK